MILIRISLYVAHVSGKGKEIYQNYSVFGLIVFRAAVYSSDFLVCSVLVWCLSVQNMGRLPLLIRHAIYLLPYCALN